MRKFVGVGLCSWELWLITVNFIEGIGYNISLGVFEGVLRRRLSFFDEGMSENIVNLGFLGFVGGKKLETAFYSLNDIFWSECYEKF